VKVAAVDGDPTKLSADGLLISDKAADKLGVGVGDSVKIALGRHPAHDYQVAATYEPNQLLGDYVLEASQARLFSNVRNVAALVDLSPGASVGDTRKALDQALARFPNIEVQDRSEFVQAAADQVDQIVAIISILLLLSVIIAVLGVVNTLALSIIERTREIGLLRAVGMARRQVKRMIRVEAVVISVFGGLLGLLVGAAFGVALQRGLKGQGVTELAFPIPRLLLFLIIAGLAGVLAAWLPARRASRLNVLQAIYTE
jgi:putative ABC transport system permease protein